MARPILLTALIVLLVSVTSACDTESTPPRSEDPIDAKIDQIFDLSDLDTSAQPSDEPTTCLYKIDATEALIRKAQNRERLFDNGLQACTWTEDTLEVKYTPSGRFFTRKGSLGDALFPSDWSCPKPSDALFEGLSASASEVVSSFSAPIGCVGARQQGSHTNTFMHPSPGPAEAGRLICFRVQAPDLLSETLGAAPAQRAATVVQSWQRKFGFPARYVLVSGEQLDVMLNRQYPALGAAWDDILFQWLTDLGFEPLSVECPTIDGL